MTIVLDVLPAAYGDALVITYGPPGDVHRLIVDGGPAATYASGLRAYLAALPEAERRFELFVVSHIDADHIDGGLLLLQDTALGAQIGDVWFNGWPQIDRASRARSGGAARRVPQRRPAGPALEHHLLGPAGGPQRRPTGAAGRRGRAHRPLPDRHGARTPAQHLGVDARAGGVQVRRQCGRRPPLARRRPVHPPGGRRRGTRPGRVQARKRPCGGERLEHRPALPTRGPPLAPRSRRSLQRPRGRAPRPGRPVRHHDRGRRPVQAPPPRQRRQRRRAELLSLVRCDRYVVSTNGDHFHHPDAEAIELLGNVTTPPTVYFNYRSDTTERWADEAEQRRVGITSVYGDGHLRIEV